MADQVRHRAFFTGRVQGVGFRQTTCMIARGHPVVGTVRNLPDGRVEVVAEGAPDAVDQFLSAVETEMRGYIRSVQVEKGAATGEFGDFRVRY